MGWYDGILNIDINQDPNNAPNYENLIKNYGSITMEQVLTSEQSYIAWEGRHAQDTHMLYQCLMISLTGEEKKKVMIWSDQYEFEVNGVEYNSGVALLKVIIRESHIDTNATTNQIRMKLSSLDNHPSNWPPPKAGEKKENMFKKYKWYWCGKETGGHYELWRAHKPEDCRGGTKKGEDTSNKKKRDSPEDPKKWKDQNAAKKLKIAKAYVAKMEATCNNTFDDESGE